MRNIETERSQLASIMSMAVWSNPYKKNYLMHGTGLLSLKLRHWLYLDQILLENSVDHIRIIP